MKIRIRIDGWLEMEFEHDVQQTGTHYIADQCMPFVKQCITTAVEEARKLQLPPAPATA